jgi:hypothetical protein
MLTLLFSSKVRPFHMCPEPEELGVFFYLVAIALAEVLPNDRLNTLIYLAATYCQLAP